VAVPGLGRKLRFHLPGAHQEEIAAPNAHAEMFFRLIEKLVGHAEAVGEPIHAQHLRDVEEHAAADHLLPRLLDAALTRAEAGDGAAVAAVPHPVAVEDVTEAVPLRAALR